MNRRQFNHLGSAFMLCEVLAASPLLLADEKTTMSGDFFLLTPKDTPEGKWGLRVKDYTIDNMSFPRFTWQWIGFNLATGVLLNIGGQLFSALTNAIFHNTQKSLEQLLQEQLETFLHRVQQAIDQNEVRRYTSLVQSYCQRFTEYSGSPDKERLTRLLDDTSDTLMNLGNLGFTAYRTYMSAAGLRLSVLQEGQKRGLAKLADFENQVNISTGHHRDMIAYIDTQTSPSTYYTPGTQPQNCFDNRMVGFTCSSPGGYSPTPPKPVWYFNTVLIKQNICGEDVEGHVLIKANERAYTLDEISHDKPLVAKDWKSLADQIVDFPSLRQKIKAKNTDLGEKMVQKWAEAAKKAKRKASGSTG